MPAIRSQTLEEWFLDHQLMAVRRQHFHLPFTVDVDVTEIEAAWQERGRVPWPAIVVRAAALTARRRPAINRVLFRTPIGSRVLEFGDEVHVNVPVLMDLGDRPRLSAVVVRDAADRTVDDIRGILRAARERTLEQLPIGRWLDGDNTWWRRLPLRLLHAATTRLPWLYARWGGGISVSSLIHRDRPEMIARGTAQGHTAWTIGIWGVDGPPGGRRVLHLGVAFDHAVLGGDEFLDALGVLVEALSDPTASGLLPPEREDRAGTT